MAVRKTLVIGLDGAPYELIKKWSEAGDLPHLAKLIERGCFWRAAFYYSSSFANCLGIVFDRAESR